MFNQKNFRDKITSLVRLYYDKILTFENKIKSIIKRYFRFIIIVIPPIIFTLLLYVYFFRSYESVNPQINPNNNNQAVSKIIFDPYSVRDFLPDSIRSNLKFELCLDNKNEVYVGDKRLDLSKSAEGDTELENTVGAMAIRASLIPALDLYREIGDSGCVTVDADNLFNSDLTGEVNNGRPIISSSVEMGKTNIRVFQPTVSIKSHLYARIQRNSLVFIVISLYILWPGFILLFTGTISFIKGNKK